MLHSNRILGPKENVLKQLGLPWRLIEMLRDETVFAELEEALTAYRALEAALSAWEAANPAAAALVPWAKTRQEWKEKGSPAPDWYALLWVVQNPHVLIKKKEIEQGLLTHSTVLRKQRYWDKKRAARKAALNGKAPNKGRTHSRS